MNSIAASTPIYSQFKDIFVSSLRYIYDLGHIYFSYGRNWICFQVGIGGAGLLTIQLSFEFKRMEGSIII